MDRRKFILHATSTGSALAMGGSESIARALAQTDAAHLTEQTGALILRKARIYDGSGNAAFIGDVAIANGRIMEVATHIAQKGSEEVDLSGLALCPGFIDIHSHTAEGLVRDPSAASKVRQGVTTEVAGQDGSSISREDTTGNAPFTDIPSYFKWLDANGAAVNVASMVGAGTLRGQVVGQADRRATDDEIARMTQMVRDALAIGACGVSTGLEYTPGGYADTAELEKVVSPLRGTGLPFASHMRNEDDRVFAAMEEVMGIGQRANVATHISHIKAEGQRNWWKMKDMLRIIDDARAAGQDVSFDIYPYVAYSTGVTNLFPLWSRADSTDKFLARLADASDGPRIESAVRDKIAMLGTWDAIQFTSAGNDQYSWIVGKRLGALAKEKNVEPYALLLDIVKGTRGRPGTAGFGMSEENVAMGIAHAGSMICSDASAVALGQGSPHPRAYGSFPRVLGHFARDSKTVSLAAAIRKMTALPAARLKFKDRGMIAKGKIADLVVFDPAKVADKATFENPHQYPVGIPHVIVNGVFVIRDGEYTKARPGRAVRANG